MGMKFLDHFDHSERKQDKEHFIHLIQIAKADGKIEESELKMLHRLGSKLGLTQPEIEDLLQSDKRSDYIPPYELSNRFEQMYDFIHMILADGKIDESEKILVNKLAIKSGFAEEDLPILVAVLTEGIKKGSDEEDLFALYKKKRIAK